MRHDDGRSECRERNPARSLHQQHCQEDESEPDEIPEQYGAHHEAETDSSGHRHQTGGEKEVHEHEGDAVGAGVRAVQPPDDAADGDEHRGDDEAPPDHVLGDVHLGRRTGQRRDHRVGGRRVAHRVLARLRSARSASCCSIAAV